MINVLFFIILVCILFPREKAGIQSRILARYTVPLADHAGQYLACILRIACGYDIDIGRNALPVHHCGFAGKGILDRLISLPKEIGWPHAIKTAADFAGVIAPRITPAMVA